MSREYGSRFGNLGVIRDIQREQLQLIPVRAALSDCRASDSGIARARKNFAVGIEKLAGQFESDAPSGAGDKDVVDSS